MASQLNKIMLFKNFSRGFDVCFLLLFADLLVITTSTTMSTPDVTQNDMSEFSRRLAIFSINVYSKLSLLKPNANLVFSPISIQTCAAMARFGAEHQTAIELDHGLDFNSNEVQQIAESFYNVLSAYEKSKIMHIANKIYVMQGYSVRSEFNELLSKWFLTSADEIDFGSSSVATQTINSWIESSTNNTIKYLLPASAVDQSTRIVLLNAIYFKGEWEHKFPKHATRTDDFYINEQNVVKLPMMNLKARFRYAELPQLDATALEMPYRDSNLMMLILLPNSRTGLKELEHKLKSIQLSEITQKLYSTQVIVKLPKFKVEFEVDLSDTFKELGMSRMFSDSAEFGKMLNTKEQLKISKIMHKAVIDISEEGTEASAATAAVVRLKRSLPSPSNEFIVDHPFLYVINHLFKSQSVSSGSGDENGAQSNEYPTQMLPFFIGSIITPLYSAISHDEL